MQTVSIGDLQKNISLLTKIDDSLTIVDKRKNRAVAIVYPIKQNSVAKNLAGKYKNRVTKNTKSLQEIKEEALIEAFGKKYGLSN